MSSTKAALKAAKAALDANKYLDAIEYVKTVLKTDPKNYYAYTFAPIAPLLLVMRLTSVSRNVFLGRALEKLDQNEESEKAYEVAIGIKDQDSLAWQGLVGLYEKQKGKKLDNYHDAAIRLAEIHMNEYVGRQFFYLSLQNIVANRVALSGTTGYDVKQSWTNTQGLPKNTALGLSTDILWRCYCPPLLHMIILKVEFPNQRSPIPPLQT